MRTNVDSNSDVDRGDEQFIHLHDEEDYNHVPIVVATCDCGRTWLIWDGKRYTYTIERWRDITRKHLATITHKRNLELNK